VTTVLVSSRNPVAAGEPAGEDPVDRRLSRTPARIYLAIGTVVIALMAFGPAWLQTPMMLVVVGGGLTALHVGLRRNAVPGASAPWRAMLCACWLFVTAMLVRIALPVTGASPPTNWALIPDAVVLPAYLLLGAAFAGMLRRRRAADDDPARVDAVLVGLAAAFMIWTFLIVPSIDQHGLSALRVANAFFPVIDVVILVLVSQLLLAGSGRQPALWLLIAASSLMFTGDMLFTLRDSQLASVPQHALDVLFMATFMLVGASGLHPSMRTLTEPQEVEYRDLSRIRIGLIAVMVLAPVVITALQPHTTLLNDVVRAGLCVLILLAVLARVVRSNNSRARAELATRRRATHDALTDLPNRELLTETVADWGDRAAGQDLEISLLFIDLDRFKMVNDHWGHQVGDELLCGVAARLSGQVREGDGRAVRKAVIGR